MSMRRHAANEGQSLGLGRGSLDFTAGQPVLHTAVLLNCFQCYFKKLLLLLFLKNTYLFLGEHKQGVAQRIQSGLCADRLDSSELDAGLEPTNREIVT